MFPELPVSNSSATSRNNWKSWINVFDSSDDSSSNFGSDIFSFFERHTSDVRPLAVSSSTASLFSPRNKVPNHQNKKPKPVPRKREPRRVKRTLDDWQTKFVKLVTLPSTHLNGEGIPLQRKKMMLWGRQQHCIGVRLPPGSTLIIVNAENSINFGHEGTNKEMAMFLMKSRMDYSSFDMKKKVSHENMDEAFYHLQRVMRFELLRLLGVDLEISPHATTSKTSISYLPVKMEPDQKELKEANE